MLDILLFYKVNLALFLPLSPPPALTPRLMSHTIGHVTSQDSQNASVPTCRHCFRPFLSTLRLQRHLEAVHSPKSEVTGQELPPLKLFLSVMPSVVTLHLLCVCVFVRVQPSVVSVNWPLTVNQPFSVT